MSRIERIALASLLALAAASGCEQPTTGAGGIVPAFPATTEATGIVYYRVADDNVGRYALTGRDRRGEPVASIEIDYDYVAWTGQSERYHRPSRVVFTGPDASTTIVYSADAGETFTASIGSVSARVSGNPAFPARCRPSDLRERVGDAQLAGLEFWIARLPDISNTIGTRYNAWRANTLLLAVGSNATAVACCAGGTRACCRAGFFRAAPLN